MAAELEHAQSAVNANKSPNFAKSKMESEAEAVAEVSKFDISEKLENKKKELVCAVSFLFSIY